MYGKVYLHIWAAITGQGIPHSPLWAIDIQWWNKNGYSETTGAFYMTNSQNILSAYLCAKTQPNLLENGIAAAKNMHTY